MAKPNLQQLLDNAKGESSTNAAPRTAQTVKPGMAVVDATAKVRQVHKPGEVNISGYFPSEVKAALRMVQAKSGNNVKECLSEALGDLFRKYNVPVPVALEESRA